MSRRQVSACLCGHMPKPRGSFGGKGNGPRPVVAIEGQHLQADEEPGCLVRQSWQRQGWSGLHSVVVLSAWLTSKVQPSCNLQGAPA